VNGAAPIRIGLLFDFPQPDRGAATETAVRLGIDEVAAAGRIDRSVEFETRLARGLPSGTEHDVVTAFRELDDAGVLLVVGPSISDNGLIVAPLADAAGLASINYTGGERTRSEFMFHYQVGSLEEEPAVLAGRLASRGLTRAAVVHDHSPVGAGYAQWFDEARMGFGIELTGSVAVPPLADDLRGPVGTLRDAKPDALVYFGLGVTSRAVALAMTELDWKLPVLANSALMFGYLRSDWRDGWAGWEYIDTIADDNERRRQLAERAPQVAAGPVPCAAYDIGRLIGEAISRARHLTRAGIKDSLERVKRLPATSGHEGTTMGFGVYDHAALKGRYLVLREWRDGRTVQVET
jgi:branched-chain amino acid transport system substrate-binding protein